MVLVDSTIQNNSAEKVTKHGITNNIRTNGTITKIDTMTSEIMKSSPRQCLSNSNPLNSSSKELKYLKCIPSSPSLPRAIPITPRKLQYNRTSEYCPLSKVYQMLNCIHLNIPPESLKTSTQAPNRTENLALIPKKNSNIVAFPSSKRIKSTVRSLKSQCSENLKLVFNNSRLCSVSTRTTDPTGKTTLRRCISEPCLVFENRTDENSQYKRRHSEQFTSFKENTGKFQLFDVPTPKKSSNCKMPNGKSSSANSKAKNTQKTSTKSSTQATGPKFKLARSSTLDSKKTENTAPSRATRRKINHQGTQVEQTTKEVESQTDFKGIKDRPAPSDKRKSSSTDNKESKQVMKKTVVIPFSFMDRVTAFMERKLNRINSNDIKYEMKRWARPPVILKKQPFKVSYAVKKITVPDPIKLETDFRKQKWEEFMKKFNQRQQELEKEKQNRLKTEIKKFRSTLIPKINPMPYKKLGIKPKKLLISQFRKSREQSKKMDHFKYSTKDQQANKKTRKNNRAKLSDIKQFNRKKISLEVEKNSNTISTENAPIKFKNCSKTTNKTSSITQETFINEKNNSNVKDSRILSVDRNNNNKKISFKSRNESRSNNYTSRGNSFPVKDHFDGLHERSATPSINSKQQIKVSAIKTPRKVF